jgi:diguanylate cyclase (GGDEF)-like protein
VHISDLSTLGPKPRHAALAVVFSAAATSAFLIWGYLIKSEAMQVRMDYAAAGIGPHRTALTESIGRLDSLVGFGVVLVVLSVFANAATGWYQWRIIAMAHREREAAKTDHFTGFLTRQVFMRAIRFGLNPGHSLGNSYGLVAVVSIDRFSDVVAEHGIAVADNVAISVAGALKRLELPGALLCRYGESSFAIALERSPDSQVRAVLKALGGRIPDELARSRKTASNVTVSVGISASPGLGAEALLRSAIVLNAQARDAGGDRVKAEGLAEEA